MMRFFVVSAQGLLVLLCWLLGTGQAHDPGLSAAALRLVEAECAVHLTLARRDIETLVRLDADNNGTVTPAEFEAARQPLNGLASRLLSISSDDQRLSGQVVSIWLDDSDAVHVQLAFPGPSGAWLHVSAPVIAELTRGHRQYVSVHDSLGRLVVERILDAEHTAFTLPLAAPTLATQAPTFGAFLRLGVEHIVTGYDHVLFLFALLIVGRSFWDAWRVITAFTVAHSLTLALATYDLIRLPPHLVEPLIAVSIVYVGLENLCRRDLRHRWLLTFGFGLVHGLGFATVLRDLGLGTAAGSAAVVPLLAFNLGVELGQVGIAALVLPLLWKGQRLPQFFPRFATVCSVLVMLAGTYWLIERTTVF
jgi:hypothetical protein